nr:unnamed protein product [Callosobruchus chinensis]CAH7720799.1 unnamed protein product [Callosobruchus chinensis]
MALALGLTGLVAFLTVFSGLFQVIHSNPVLSLVIIFSPAALVIYVRYRIQHLSAQSAVTTFFSFSVLMGLSLSYVFIVYTAENIARAFFITSIMFGSIPLYGNTTKRDLTSMGSFLIMGALGIIIASIVNLFLGSSPLYFAISFISVIVFTLMTAYVAQRIKDVYYKYNDGSEVATTKLATLGATDLYFNFINIFLNLLRLLNLFNNRDKMFSFSRKGSKNSIVFFLISLVVLMLCLAYASVPLYSIFCKATGYGGTTRKVTISATDQKIRVHFNADIMSDLPWEFKSEPNYVDVNIGEQSLAFYYAKNLSDHLSFGMAVYNVTAFKAGKYFNKVACFCFEEQMLLPKQKAAMPVSLYIHPEIMLDSNTKDLSEITLSFTFFKLK